MGAPKAPGDEAKHHIMRLGAHILHPPPLKPNLHPLLAFGGVPTCVHNLKFSYFFNVKGPKGIMQCGVYFCSN